MPLMGIKESLFEEYGVTVRIASGSGPKHDPFVLEACNALEATHTQLEVIKWLSRRMGFIHRLREVAAAPDVGPSVQLVAFDRAHLVGGQMQQETVACYFDHSAVTGEPHPAEPLFVWHDPRSPIMLPHELGWLHFTNFRNYDPESDQINQSCAYHGPGAMASIYVYAHEQPANSTEQMTALSEAEVADILAHVQAGPEGFALTHAPLTIGVFDVRILANAEDTTIIAVTCAGPTFIKARISMQTLPTMLDRMVATLQELSNLVERARPAAVQ
jgi:hypothetical protein